MTLLPLSDMVSHVLSSGASESQVALFMLTRHCPWFGERVSVMFAKRPHVGPP
jgi:hypothetical protein